ncbi:GntR family transcriptional regulator [Rhodococcus erythropolis]|uniref:GntR family transcriptional regulator n=1 Tax=Rhodococcus erythropolis TaxID=1833 RepID=UPI001BED1C3D|nr:GntR family transcriptional regulator [Rhodococcus erythropolis]MBT2268987.1 GntR family transcriptional regulator [Rhodococcus erythropolis]
MLTTRDAKSTKSETAYWLLREAIVRGDIEADTPLDDGTLMKQLGVGRTPVREAIKRLALEEFVIWPTHRTPYVRTTSSYDLSQLYEARHIFEIPAARLAAERCAPADLAELERHCSLLDDAIDSGDMYRVAEHDYDFHIGVAKASKNRFLADAVSHLNCGSLRLWYQNYTQLGTDRISEDHRRILTALREHDVESAASAGFDHVQFSHERQLQLHGLTPASTPVPRTR